MQLADQEVVDGSRAGHKDVPMKAAGASSETTGVPGHAHN